MKPENVKGESLVMDAQKGKAMTDFRRSTISSYASTVNEDEAARLDNEKWNSLFATIEKDAQNRITYNTFEKSVLAFGK